MLEEVGGARVGIESMNTTRIHYTHVRIFTQVKKKESPTNRILWILTWTFIYSVFDSVVLLGTSGDPEDRVSPVCGYVYIYLCMHFFGLGHRGTEKAVVPDATVHTVCPAGFCCTSVPALIHGLLQGNCTRLSSLSPAGRLNSEYCLQEGERAQLMNHDSPSYYIPYGHAEYGCWRELDSWVVMVWVCVCTHALVCVVLDNCFPRLLFFSIYFWLAYNEFYIIMTFLNKIIVVLLPPSPIPSRWASCLSLVAFPFPYPMYPWAYPILSHQLLLPSLGLLSRILNFIYVYLCLCIYTIG